MMRRLLCVLFVVAILHGVRAEEEMPKAPDFKLTTLEDREFNFGELKGQVIVVLHFWETGCKQCHREVIPVMEDLAEYFRGAPAAFYVVNLKESKSVILKYLETMPVKVPIAFNHDGALKELADKFGKQGVVIIDKDLKMHFLPTEQPLSSFRRKMAVDLDKFLRAMLDEKREKEKAAKSAPAK